MNQITVLVLCRSEIGDDDLKALADALCINRSIQAIDLSGNQIGDDGMKVLADALRVNRGIEWLDFKANPIGDEGAWESIRAICRNRVQERERELARAEREMQKSP
eukprot:symbB.v1.2.024075.t1/scaffold2082.1/size125690/3